MVWCGERKGRLETSVAFSGSLPVTEWILVVSNASCNVSCGKMVGRRLSSMILLKGISPYLCHPKNGSLAQLVQSISSSNY
jgi:hypothetical protein